ncbi:MAG TPA: tetratricopeptide repeat protein [Drouetiella sp.]
MGGLKLKIFLISLAIICGAGQARADGDWEQTSSDAQEAYDRGELDDAQSKWEEALKQAESSKAVEPGMVTCLCKLALVNDRKHNSFEAERLYELAMRTMEGLAGPNSTRFADWMPDLAWMYQGHGRPDKAEVLFKRALKIKETTYGGDDERVARALDDYARFLRKENRSTEASSLEQRARTIRSKIGS